ncbi:MAG: hypothetical protein JW913_03610 [Chitinispirillaceae bacterium]|nr:hypothetical protein [Chitinispirillaceae bacterium]
MAEEKIGVVRTKLKGTDFDLYITTERIVAAKTGSVVMWGAFFGAIGQGLAAYFSKKKSAQLRELTIESIATSDKNNFTYALSAIDRAQLKKPGKLSAAALSLDHDGKTTKFTLMEKKQFEQDKEVFEKGLGEKLQMI